MYAIRIISPGVYTNKQAKNIPNIVLNSLVDTLNVKAKVPHTLIIILNDHRFWNDSNMLKYQMERILARFFKEIRRIAEARNNSLPPRAVNWDYPRIFVTKALPLPNNLPSYPRGFKANRAEFNMLLQQGEQQHNYKSIALPEFTCDNEHNLFNKYGSLTQKGYRTLWITISDAVHRSDNLTRININKAKAKQLSAQITLTKSELNDDDQSEDSLSGIQYLGDNTHRNAREPKPTKRALINDFNAQSRLTEDDDTDSPTSVISEFYTIQHKQQ